MGSSRTAKITSVHLDEARRLRELWERTEHPNQTVFGEQYGIGTQSAVGQFLRGEIPLSVKAAVGFARGVRITVAEISPRIATELAE